MTSAVHDGIHNVPRHVVGVGRVDIMSSIYELVVLQNQVLIYSPTSACARLQTPAISVRSMGNVVSSRH